MVFFVIWMFLLSEVRIIKDGLSLLYTVSLIENAKRGGVVS